jgi:hypothetical protein
MICVAGVGRDHWRHELLGRRVRKVRGLNILVNFVHLRIVFEALFRLRGVRPEAGAIQKLSFGESEKQGDMDEKKAEHAQETDNSPDAAERLKGRRRQMRGQEKGDQAEYKEGEKRKVQKQREKQGDKALREASLGDEGGLAAEKERKAEKTEIQKKN